ncbi:Neutral endopeptidase [Lactococcus lactis]|nr:Neutral endopeptidase [Lactococcus lactis]
MKKIGHSLKLGLTKIARGATSFFNEDLRILGGAYGRFLSNVQEARSQEKHQL